VVVPEFSAIGVGLAYSVMAGVLWYLVNRNKSTDDTLSGWKIEEEKRLV